MKTRMLLKKKLLSLLGVAGAIALILFLIFPKPSIIIISLLVSDITTEKEPAPVYNIVWNVLDDDLVGKKIKIDFDDYENTFSKTLTIGKTKRIRLPYGSFHESVNEKDSAEKGIFLDMPQGLSMRWREDLDKYQKEDAYEIIVFKEAELSETDEAFILSSAPKAKSLAISYYDKEKENRAAITKQNDSGRVFLKSESEKTKADVMDDAVLEIKVKSLLPNVEKTYTYKAKYFREMKYLYGTFIEQNDKKLRVQGISLNGENSIEAQYVDKDGNSLAGYEAIIYAFFPDGTLGTIETKTDDSGYVKIDSLPETEYRISFGEKAKDTHSKLSEQEKIKRRPHKIFSEHEK